MCQALTSKAMSPCIVSLWTVKTLLLERRDGEYHEKKRRQNDAQLSEEKVGKVGQQ